jgi:FkbM family methyltransferase
MENIQIIEARYGKMMVHKLDRYLSRSLIEYGEFSEGEAEVFRQIITKDHVVIDCGANIGAHTILFAKLAKTVYAFEPQKHIFHILCGNVALNELHNVNCYNIACGDGSEVPYQDIDMDHLNNMGAGGLLDIQSENHIPTMPLDIPCHFLKIDVEGMELQVLQGAAPMINACRPVVYLENDRPDKSKQLIEFLNSLGYKCFWHSTTLFNPNNYFANPNDVFGDVGSINMLCVPDGIVIQGLDEAKPEVDWHELWSTHEETFP